jgi:hypothetical protein
MFNMEDDEKHIFCNYFSTERTAILHLPKNMFTSH